MVLPDSHEISRAPCYLGTTQHSQSCFVYGSRTLYAQPFKTVRLHNWFLTAHPAVRQGQHCPTTPQPQPLTGLTRSWFSLIRFRSPLLTESLLFSLPVGTEMFHFPTFPPNTLCVQVQVPRHDSWRVSPFGNPRITACLSTPRGISQITTSFIGSWCQGIHRVPLKT